MMIAFGLLPVGMAVLWLVWCLDDIRDGARYAMGDVSEEASPSESPPVQRRRRPPRCNEPACSRNDSTGHAGLTGSSIWMLHA